MKRVMGLDLSSTTCGWSILDYDKDQIKLVACGHIKPNKKVSLFKSFEGLKKDILSVVDLFKPDDVAIENIIEYMANKSSARSIIVLATYNRMVGFAVYEATSKEPNLYSVMSIRHKIKLNKVFPKKEDIPLLLEKRLGIDFPWVKKMKKKRGQKIATEEICVESYDVADGIAVGLYHCMINQK